MNDQMWSLFPELLALLEHYLRKNPSYYIIDPIVLAICNYIQTDPKTFTTVKMHEDSTPLDILFEKISIILQVSHEGAN